MFCRDSILINGLGIECVVGVGKDERLREQLVIIDATLELDISQAGHSGKISNTCDYDRVANEITSMLRFRRYVLLEMAAHEIPAMLLGVHSQIETVHLRIRKPRALEGRANYAAIEVSRHRNDYPRQREHNRFGEVEILLETRDAGLYLLHVDAGQQIEPHHHCIMRELEWLTSGELERNGKSMTMAKWDPVEWSLHQIHGYRNPGSERASLFCCDTPPFVRSDEIISEFITAHPPTKTPSKSNDR